MALLDVDSLQCGEYLIKRYCSQEGICGIRKEDVSAAGKSLQGPKELITKVLKGSSVTVKRNACKPERSKTPEERKEEQRTRKLAQDQKRTKSLYSDQNTCQAVVDPTCSKYKVTKSVYVPKALKAVTGIALQHQMMMTL
jgi:hypothetical protein